MDLIFISNDYCFYVVWWLIYNQMAVLFNLIAEIVVIALCFEGSFDKIKRPL